MARTVDPEKHRAKRRQIMNAAARLFATQGYRGTTTAQVCAAAGISSGSLFHYFASKRELFAAILTDDGEDTTGQALATARVAEDPLTGLLDFVDHLCAAAAVPIVPGLVLEAMFQARRDPELASLLDEDSAAEQAGVMELLSRAAEAGAIDTELDVEDTAAWIMALVGGVYLHAATDESPGTTRQLTALRRTVARYLGA